MNNKLIHVAVAALVNGNREVLVSQRKQGTHLGGYWEFPGGKQEPGESVEEALRRELGEELGIKPLSSRPLIRVRYDYPVKSVLLDVWKIESFSGLPEGLEGQRIAWRSINDLEKKLFPPADLPVITALQLPSRCLITGAFTSTIDFESKLSAALNDGIRLVQLRLTHDWLKSNTLTYAHEIMQLCHRLCEQNSSKLMLNIPEGLKPLKGCGLHLNSRKLLEHGNRPGYEMVSASCHNRIELERAQSIGVDFALLSPVRETCSHPGAQALGWEAFSELVDDINIPVYALGGMSTEDTGLAWKSGGQGIAAIGAFWNQLH